MLKTVSSIANALGALNYKGTWDANANSPALASSVGTKGDYYVVSVAGTTALNGISNWGIGDWVTYNGTAWQRVEGGADLNGVNLSVTGTSNLTGDVTITNNLVQLTAAKGINFTANTPAAGMTSQLLNWYEEGTWTPTDVSGAGLGLTVTYAVYTRIGRHVTALCYLKYPVTANIATATISLPHTVNGYIIGTASATTGNIYSTITIGGTTTTTFRNASLLAVTNASLSTADILFSLTYTV